MLTDMSANRFGIFTNEAVEHGSLIVTIKSVVVVNESTVAYRVFE